MDTLSNELNLLASLLNAPDLCTKEAVLELAEHYPWLKPATEELEKLPVDVWQAEHKRLFLDCAFALQPCDFKQLTRRPHGPPLKTLQQLYKRMGLGFAETSADYFGTLLECAAYLNANPNLGKIYWSELWHDHLACWIPGFCKELKAESRLAIYRVIAERLNMLFPQVQQLAKAAA